METAISAMWTESANGWSTSDPSEITSALQSLQRPGNGLSALHQEIERKNIMPKKDVSWSTWDIFKWKAKGNRYLFDKKASFVSGYSNVILDAAKMFEIPASLLAGIYFFLLIVKSFMF